MDFLLWCYHHPIVYDEVRVMSQQFHSDVTMTSLMITKQKYLFLMVVMHLCTCPLFSIAFAENLKTEAGHQIQGSGGPWAS